MQMSGVHVVEPLVDAQPFSQCEVNAVFFRQRQIAIHDGQQTRFVLGELAPGFHQKVNGMMIGVVAGNAVEILDQQALFFDDILLGLQGVFARLPSAEEVRSRV